MPVKLTLNVRRRAREHQYLRRAGRAVPKPANHAALGNITPVKSPIARRALGETRRWNIDRLKPLLEPPGQPFTTRKATPNRTIKTSANPCRNQAAGAVHGAHGFKRCAHTSNSCLPSENLKPRFPLHGNFRLYSMSLPQKPTRAFPKSSETAIAGRRRALQIDAPTMRQRCGDAAINLPASRQPR